MFFDLTFAISFGVAAGHWITGLICLGFSMFAVIWARINFSWFVSAYDTDDWVFRRATMWWLYLVLTTGTALHHRRNRSFVFGYSHIFIFTSMTAMGTGSRIYASHLAGDGPVSKLTVIMSIAIPVATYRLMLLFLYGYMPKIDPLHLFIVATCILISAGLILLVAGGFP